MAEDKAQDVVADMLPGQTLPIYTDLETIDATVLQPHVILFYYNQIFCSPQCLPNFCFSVPNYLFSFLAAQQPLQFVRQTSATLKKAKKKKKNKKTTMTMQMIMFQSIVNLMQNQVHTWPHTTITFIILSHEQNRSRVARFTCLKTK